MSAKLHIDNRSLKTLRLPEGKSEAIFWDIDLKGFGVRFHSGGKAVYVFQGRVGRQQRRVTLGSIKGLDPATARAAAKALSIQFKLGHDPIAVKNEAKRAAVRSKERLFANAVAAFLECKKCEWRPNSYRVFRRYLTQHAAPLNNLELPRIERITISRLLDDVAANSGKVTAINVRAALNSFWRWAKRRGLCENNLIEDTNSPKRPVKSERALNKNPHAPRNADPSEIATLWQALDETAGDYAPLVKLILLTGMRREEAGGLCWHEISFDEKLIIIPSHRMKNKKPHEIPMSQTVFELLQQQYAKRKGAFVFGDGVNGYSGWSRAKGRLDKRIAAIRSSEGLPPMANWTLHDLRHTFSTHLHENLNVPPHIVEAILSHSASGHQSGVAGIYNHAVYRSQKAEALERWADHIAILVGEHDVVPLRA